MSIRIRPIINIARERIGWASSLAEAAAATETIQLEEVDLHEPPNCLPGQTAKATAAALGLPLEHQLAIATGTRSVHQPALRYDVRDALVHAGGVDIRGTRVRTQRLPLRSLLSSPIRRLPKAAHVMTDVSHVFFGHWLLDACATALLRREGEGLILDIRPDWPNAAEYVAAFGFRPEPPGVYRVDRLSVFQDFAQGSSKRNRYAELRRRLEAAHPGLSTGGRLLYLRRGNSGVARLVANEDELASSLSARGFQIFDILGASLDEIVRRFRDAELVVSMEGSHLNHLHLIMSPGAALVVIIPADRFTLTQHGYARAVGLRFGFMVVDPGPGGYKVSLRDLHATLDLMGL